MINDIRHRSVELKAPLFSLHPFDGKIVFIEGQSSFAVCCCSLSAEHRTVPERYPLKYCQCLVMLFSGGNVNSSWKIECMWILLKDDGSIKYDGINEDEKGLEPEGSENANKNVKKGG